MKVRIIHYHLIYEYFTKCLYNVNCASKRVSINPPPNNYNSLALDARPPSINLY